jgi:hypothetical protein
MLNELEFRLAVCTIMTWAQFMYICRSPTRLNHVHAKSAFPAGASTGIVKVYDGLSGQDPIMDLITLKVFPRSYDSEN